MHEIEKLEAAIKAIHDKAYAELMAMAPDKDEDLLAADAHEQELDGWLADEPPARVIGGWVHRAALGTLPTFATLSTAYANLPVKE